MLKQRLDPGRFAVEVASPDLLASEAIALVEDREPAAVVIGALAGAGHALHLRSLCKRLRARFPDLPDRGRVVGCGRRRRGGPRRDGRRRGRPGDRDARRCVRPGPGAGLARAPARGRVAATSPAPARRPSARQADQHLDPAPTRDAPAVTVSLQRHGDQAGRDVAPWRATSTPRTVAAHVQAGATFPSSRRVGESPTRQPSCYTCRRHWPHRAGPMPSDAAIARGGRQ